MKGVDEDVGVSWKGSRVLFYTWESLNDVVSRPHGRRQSSCSGGWSFSLYWSDISPESEVLKDAKGRSWESVVEEGEIAGGERIGRRRIKMAISSWVSEGAHGSVRGHMMSIDSNDRVNHQ